MTRFRLRVCSHRAKAKAKAKEKAKATSLGRTHKVQKLTPHLTTYHQHLKKIITYLEQASLLGQDPHPRNYQISHLCKLEREVHPSQTGVPSTPQRDLLLQARQSGTNLIQSCLTLEMTLHCAPTQVYLTLKRHT